MAGGEGRAWLWSRCGCSQRQPRLAVAAGSGCLSLSQRLGVCRTREADGVETWVRGSSHQVARTTVAAQRVNTCSWGGSWGCRQLGDNCSSTVSCLIPAWCEPCSAHGLHDATLA